jgi:hypothetical protein
MSRDCDYIFVWDADSGQNAAQSAANILDHLEDHIGLAVFGKATVIDDFTLYWTCTKYSLPLGEIVFPNPPDQIFERADGDLFQLMPSIKRGLMPAQQE